MQDKNQTECAINYRSNSLQKTSHWIPACAGMSGVLGDVLVQPLPPRPIQNYFACFAH